MSINIETIKGIFNELFPEQKFNSKDAIIIDEDLLTVCIKECTETTITITKDGKKKAVPAYKLCLNSWNNGWHKYQLYNNIMRFHTEEKRSYTKIHLTHEPTEGNQEFLIELKLFFFSTDIDTEKSTMNQTDADAFLEFVKDMCNSTYDNYVVEPEGLPGDEDGMIFYFKAVY